MRFLFVAVIAIGLASPAYGQATASWEERGVRFFNTVEQPVFSAWVGGADATAYPVFYGGLPATWGATALGWLDTRDAVRWSASVGGAMVSAVVLKNLVRRPRPFRSLDNIHVRRRADKLDRLDSFAFPSGHATLAFAYATSLSLTFPRWYVVAPAGLWASGVAISRLWLGVHFPGDVIAGAVLGTGVALLVDVLLPRDSVGEPAVAMTPALVVTFGKD